MPGRLMAAARDEGAAAMLCTRCGTRLHCRMTVRMPGYGKDGVTNSDSFPGVTR